MKTKNLKKSSLLIAALLSIGLSSVVAQSYRLSIQNDVQTSDHTLEFDLRVLNLNHAIPIELSGIQAGIVFNKDIDNGGTITVSLVPGSSELVESMMPNSFEYSAEQHCIKIFPRMLPSRGNGTLLPTVGSGIRYCRVRITNSNAFTAKCKPDLNFSFTVSPFPTKLSWYEGSIPAMLTSDGKCCYPMAVNSPLNASSSLTDINAYPDLYPNPTKKGFFITMGYEEGVLEIFNTAGIKVVERVGTGKIYVDVSSLLPGAYEVRTKNNTYKLIKL